MSALLRRFLPLMALLATACSEVAVLQGVSEHEANRAIGALDQAGIAAHKTAEESSGTGGATFHITVAADEVPRAVGVLQAGGLPRREEPGFTETFGAQPSLVQTSSEERARAGQAIAGELARTIERIDNVLDARVHLSLPDPRELPLDATHTTRASASVLVRYTGARAPYEDDALRRLVAGAVAGMRAEDVSVMGLSRPPPTQGSAQLAWVGPIAVARGSAGTLRAVLVVTVLMNVVLAAGLLFLVLRPRKNETETGSAPPT